VAEVVTTIATVKHRRPAPPATNDVELGMAWWNRLTKIERMAALLAADTAVAAEAWAFWKLTAARD
jgi:hypothetical protein